MQAVRRMCRVVSSFRFADVRLLFSEEGALCGTSKI